MRFAYSVFTAISLALLSSLSMAMETAPVSGFARSFILGSNLSNATITILETGEQIKTDNEGHFKFQYPVGKPLTLEISKWGYKTTQSTTVIVPRKGLTGPYDNITFQVPLSMTYFTLKKVLGAKEDPESCHVAATITAFHKTMDDIPQGVEGATVTVSSPYSDVPFYFGIFKSGPLKGKTNPFVKNLTETSEDGGVLLFNVMPSDKLYTMSAKKEGVQFNKAYFWCRKGAFINLSPPRGPMAAS